MAIGVVVDLDALAQLELAEGVTLRSFSNAIPECGVRNSPPVASIPHLATSALHSLTQKDPRTTLGDAFDGKMLIFAKDPICQKKAVRNGEVLAMHQSTAGAGEPSIEEGVQPVQPRSRRVLIGVAVGFANLVLVLFGLNSLRSIRATEHSTLDVPFPVETSSLKPSQLPTVSAPAVFGKRSITITAVQGSWIDACPDGKTIFRRFVPERSSVHIPFLDQAVVRFGNAGGLQVSVDGTASGPLGVEGQTRLVQFDAKGSRFLMPGEPGTECGR